MRTGCAGGVDGFAGRFGRRGIPRYFGRCSVIDIRAAVEESAFVDGRDIGGQGDLFQIGAAGKN